MTSTASEAAFLSITQYTILGYINAYKSKKIFLKRCIITEPSNLSLSIIAAINVTILHQKRWVKPVFFFSCLWWKQAQVA
jgi:hypothetical protein